jgi:LysM repeat protein
MNPEDKKIIELLENTAQAIKPNIVFEHELDKRLTAAHKPKRNRFASLRQNTFPTLGWAVAVVVLAFGLNWATHSLVSRTPAAGVDGFICPVTKPNGNLPLNETIASPNYLGNGELWTVLSPNGKTNMSTENQEAGGSLSIKWSWWRGVTGPLTIEGHRLDAEAEPLRSDIPDGYGDTGFQVSALIFPTTGCWEVTGRVGNDSLTFVTEVLFGEATSTPIAIQEISTTIPNDGSYDWRGTKLSLAQTLPESPAETNVYSLKLSQPATMDDARALAQQFGLSGEVTETSSEIPGNFDYLIVDGKQKLIIRSNHYFTYYSNSEKLTLNKPTEEQAQIIIDEFLKQHGFDYEYHLESAPEMAGQQYYILPLTPDGHEMRFDYMMPVRFNITIDDSGQNIVFAGFPIKLESLGMFGIRSAEEAFQKVLAPNQQFGMMEIFRGNGGGGGGSSFYKLNMSGTPVPFPTSTPAPNSNRSEYIVQEGDTLTSIAESHGINIEELMQINGLSESRIFIGQILIIPRQVNIGQRLEGLRGLFKVNIYRSSNGNQRVEYGFLLSHDESPYPYMFLEGNNLSELEKYHNRPVDIWGVIDHYDNAGRPIVKVERYEIPYPDMKIQVLQGTQENIELDGKAAVLFTTNDGIKYVQLFPAGDLMVDIDIDPTKPQLFIECLVIPNETYAGYQTIRYFAGGFVFNPQDGTPMEYEITVDQPYIIDDVPADTYIPPTATIEKVELAYYIRNPIYSMTDPNAGADAQYLQPVWRFYGHYSSGEEFEILIQALKDEFLYPELALYTPPG